MTHRVAAEGFGRSVEAYRRSRPSYPSEAIAWLVDALELGSGRVVVDVGAGTGKLTELLVPTGARVIAIEPLAAMRGALTEDMPNVELLAGTAESLPLADASADAIVAGQAFHWFDRSRAVPEFARVLRPSGRLAAIWNNLDTSVEWVRELNAIVAVPRAGTPHPSEARSVDLGDNFTRLALVSFAHAHSHDRASLLERVASMSFVAVLPETQRKTVFEQVAALIDKHPQTAGRPKFDLPYVTEAWSAERRGILAE